MGKLKVLKQNTEGTIAALQTCLERYPVLFTTDETLGKSSLSVCLNLLKRFGITETDIIEWLANILADKKDNTEGLLTAIEATIKTILLTTLKETYTCSINPTLPNDILLNFYNGEVRGNGLKLKLGDIDVFGQLSYCPTDTNGLGTFFYFDNKNGYTPLNIYSSTDFNAYLWYVINKGVFGGDINEKIKCVWDNRALYANKFAKDGSLNGISVDPGVDPEKTLKGRFFNTKCDGSTMRHISKLGPKMEILSCQYKDEELNGPILNIHLNSDRYRNSITGVNKTIFDFNVDYILSLKLFDTKTLLAQVINALLGVSANLNPSITIEKQVLKEQVRKVIKNVIESEDDEEEENNNCYFTFSNDEYNAMLNDAKLKYDGEYYSGNETNENISLNTEEIFNLLYKIEDSDNLNEETTAIKNIINDIAKNVAKSPQVEEKYQVSFGLGIITKFLEETITEIIMQILSPKVMILFAINDSIMNNDSASIKTFNFTTFFSKFENLMVLLIKEVLNLIVTAIYDYLIGQITPIITLFTQKLLLETFFYYKILIEQVLTTCTYRFTNGGNILSVDNVVGADIIPTETKPITECRR